MYQGKLRILIITSFHLSILSFNSLFKFFCSFLFLHLKIVESSAAAQNTLHLLDLYFNKAPKTYLLSDAFY